MISVRCPDCKRGTIPLHDRCDGCGLSWEALMDAADVILTPVQSAIVDKPKRPGENPPKEEVP